MLRGDLQHRALDDTVFADGFFGFGREGFKRRCKIFSGGRGSRFLFGCGCGNDGVSSVASWTWFVFEPELREFELRPFPAFQDMSCS